MAIKMSMTCTRCHREDMLEVAQLSDATALEELQKRKAVTLEKLKAFIATLPAHELPDLFAIYGEKTIIHPYLCDPPEEGKRSCDKRISAILASVTEVQARQPRVKKDKPAEKPTT